MLVRGLRYLGQIGLRHLGRFQDSGGGKNHEMRREEIDKTNRYKVELINTNNYINIGDFSIRMGDDEHGEDAMKPEPMVEMAGGPSIIIGGDPEQRRGDPVMKPS